jgi:hypothetical protein
MPRSWGTLDASFAGKEERRVGPGGSAVALAAGTVLGLALYPWTDLPFLLAGWLATELALRIASPAIASRYSAHAEGPATHHTEVHAASGRET